MEKMTCPECGKEFDDLEMQIGENGNPICQECAANEDKDE